LSEERTFSLKSFVSVEIFRNIFVSVEIFRNIFVFAEISTSKFKILVKIFSKFYCLTIVMTNLTFGHFVVWKFVTLETYKCLWISKTSKVLGIENEKIVYKFRKNILRKFVWEFLQFCNKLQLDSQLHHHWCKSM